jgi:hypothetical protein
VTTGVRHFADFYFVGDIVDWRNICYSRPQQNKKMKAQKTPSGTLRRTRKQVITVNRRGSTNASCSSGVKFTWQPDAQRNTKQQELLLSSVSLHTLSPQCLHKHTLSSVSLFLVSSHTLSPQCPQTFSHLALSSRTLTSLTSLSHTVVHGISVYRTR